MKIPPVEGSFKTLNSGSNLESNGINPEQFPMVAAVAYVAAPKLVVTATVNPDIARSVPVISLATGRPMLDWAFILRIAGDAAFFQGSNYLATTFYSKHSNKPLTRALNYAPRKLPSKH